VESGATPVQTIFVDFERAAKISGILRKTADICDGKSMHFTWDAIKREGRTVKRQSVRPPFVS